MFKHFLEFKRSVVLSAVIGLGLIASATIAFAAWSAAPANPPNDNTLTPINVGPYQQKAGGLRAGQLFGSGWNYFNNKARIQTGAGDDRSALIFGATDDAHSWFLGQADETGNAVVASDVFGLWSWKGGWVQRWHPNGNVGIGVVPSGAGPKLEVAGQVKITGGSPDAGKVLTSNSTGLATWEAPIGGGGGTPHGKQRFTSSGTFTVPADVTKVWVSMSGGGGGGGGASNGFGGGGGGGGAHAVIAQEISVSSGLISVTVGTGGTGGDIDNIGGTGGTSSFGSLFTNGGAGGSKGSGGGAGYAGIGGKAGGIGGSDGGYGNNYGGYGPGGPGGGSIFGAGDNVKRGNSDGGSGGGYGGGGGGGGYYSGSYRGGSGSPGFVLVEW